MFASKFKQPFAEVGMAILWFSDISGQAAPSPAVVTEVHDQTIRCSVTDGSMANLMVKTGVRHRSDPALKNIHADNDSGCWDYTERDKRLMQHVPEVFQPPAPRVEAKEPAKKAA